ncbi:hypothetical protein BU23DRAFT_628781 [Bimuria novae-zelandiae CBS 107.79]|uniref:Uncharacterized protein n=1 Tax=Bimuria novae-zelandiae CBS 107.79 TaxID=1447943 RepID=A0A6A5UQN8_9PLEO|nr:hypothetical protein BU23DRAFT_628781 [Bimuria novae-zelandiae CBS 107.79]
MQHLPSTPISDTDMILIQEIYARAFDNDEAMKNLKEELLGASDLPPSEVVLRPENHGLGTMETLPVGDGSDEILRSYGAFDMKLDPSSEYIDFTNIHPLFRVENCALGLNEEVTRKGWEAMAPARALATKFITTPELSAFWYRLAFGTPAVHSGKRYLARSPLEDQPKLARVSFESLLLDLSTKLHFWWAPTCLGGIQTLGCFTTSIFGVVGALNPSEGRAIAARSGHQYNQGEYFDGYISLSVKYLYHLLSQASSVRTDGCAMLRIQSSIAHSLCHEICHAIYSYRGLEMPEAYVFLSDEMAEAGFSFPFNVFGAEVGPVSNAQLSNEIGCFYGSDWRSMFGFPQLRTIVNMRWVEAWFRKDTWERIDEVMKNDLLKLPSATGFSGPALWVVHRFTESPFGKGFYSIHYRDRKAVFPEWAIGKVDGPPEGVTVDQWFTEISRRDKEAALAVGISEDIFIDPKGLYKNEVQP